MTHSKKTIYTLILLCAVLALAFIAIRAVQIVTLYDITEGHFRAGSDAVVIASGMCGAVALILFVLGFLPKPGKSFGQSSSPSHVTVFSGALCGFMFVSAFFIQIFYFAKDVTASGSLGEKILFFSSLVMTLPTAAYFFKAASTLKMKKLNVEVLSLCPIIWCILYLVFTYFRADLTMNSPTRLAYQVALIAAMLCTVLEARSRIGIPKNRLYVAMSLASVFLIFVISIPDFLLSSFWLLPFGIQTVYSATLTAYGVYVLARLASHVSEPIAE